jgi:hypothetical protein
VVKEPQNPIAIKNEYFESRLKKEDNIENAPKIKLPIILTIKTLEPTIPKITGKDVSLYLAKAPNTAPITKSANSKSLIIVCIFFIYLIYFYVFGPLRLQ